MENRQWRLAWQTVKEGSERKSTSRGKIKASSQEERLSKWKKHFKNLLGNPPEITYPTQLDIKLGQFTEEEFSAVLKKQLKTKKLPGVGRNIHRN